MNVFVATLPLASVAVQVTRVWPTRNVLPDAGVQTTSGLGSSLSVAVGSAYVTTVLAAAVSTVMSGTSPNTGATVSGTNAPAANAAS